MKLLYFLAAGSLSLLILPVHAQQSDSTSTQIPAPIKPSLRAHLQLKAAQIDELNELYDNWVTKRSDFSAVQKRALKILTPLQRAQLDSIVQDSRLRLRDDQYSQLLLAPTRQNLDDSRSADNRRDNRRQRESEKTRQQNRPRRGNGSYGVYGGYGYGGPNYGVYGNYGQGNVGVGATIGRYGPSIGVNVGRVFGGRWLR